MAPWRPIPHSISGELRWAGLGFGEEALSQTSTSRRDISGKRMLTGLAGFLRRPFLSVMLWPGFFD
jgi:hypothetical protein